MTTEMIRGVANDLKNKITIGVLTRIRDAVEALICQIQGRDGEQRDKVTMLYPFGFDAYPIPADGVSGPESVVMVLGGNNRYALPPMDRRHRAKSGVTKSDEAALYNTRARITLLADGTIEMRGRRLDISVDEDVAIAAPGGVKMTTPLLDVSGDAIDQTGSGNGLTLAAMRGVYNGHTHPENDNGGPTGAPNQQQ